MLLLGLKLGEPELLFCYFEVVFKGFDLGKVFGLLFLQQVVAVLEQLQLFLIVVFLFL